MEDEELIRQQMEQTRTSLSEKLETLEQKVMDTVTETKSAIQDTVCTVKESVNDTVSSVKESMHEGVESVKGFVDVKAHVEERPWLMVGGSILCGYVLGAMLTESKPKMEFPATPATPPPRRGRLEGNGHHKRSEPQQAAASKSESSGLFSAMQPEIDKLKGLALGAVLGTVREMITKQTPPHMADQLRQVIDGITEKIGGEPMPASDFSQSPVMAGESESGRDRGSEFETPRW
jgi:ElaB/YqjD/DUF883 family membrane-anchored ribosome-binding protein